MNVKYLHGDNSIGCPTTQRGTIGPEEKVIRDDSIINPIFIKGLIKGEHLSFNQIFHFYYPRVKAFLSTLTRDADLTDELSQKVFVSLWLNRERIDPSKNFSAYIFRIAKNAALTAFRDKERRQGDSYDYWVDKESSKTDDEIIAYETGLMIRLVVSRMPEKRRQVYEMSRNDNKSKDEIATELNISKKVVEKHLRLALSDIREVLKTFIVFFMH